MDSLLANYASSSEDESEEISRPIPPPKLSFFSSLPPPQSHFTTHSLHDYKSEIDGRNPSSKPSSSSIFSSLPTPKSSSSDQNPRRIVHFTPPLNPSLLKSQDPDDDDDEDDQKRRSRKIAPSSSSSNPKPLSSILPAPRNSLCVAPARRSSLQRDVPSASSLQESNGEKEAGSFESDYAGYETYGSYGGENGVGDYGNCGDQWSDVGGAAAAAAAATEIFDIGSIGGKRGRADVPIEIVEVKQDELMKNRPREDQVKSTGIAFGPAYQSAPSAKGKPSKLHKRKHQIGSLFYDVKQKEMELAERRSKGFLTKAETQAKYGW